MNDTDKRVQEIEKRWSNLPGAFIVARSLMGDEHAYFLNRETLEESAGPLASAQSDIAFLLGYVKAVRQAQTNG